MIDATEVLVTEKIGYLITFSKLRADLVPIWFSVRAL